MEEQDTSRFLETMESVLEDTSSWLSSTLNTLGWDRETLMQSENLQKCEIDPSHTVPATSLEEHVKCCRLRKEGYTTQDIKMDYSPRDYYSNYKNIVTIDIDESSIGTILARTRPGLVAGGSVKREMPVTVESEKIRFNTGERLALYEYCVDSAKAANGLVTVPPEELTMLDTADTDNKPKSELERLAMERDMKRRRQSYKGKSTHTGKKSHLDVIRDVIENQTERLGKIWEERMDNQLTKQLRSVRDEVDKMTTGKLGENGNGSERRIKVEKEDSDYNRAYKRSRSRSRERRHKSSKPEREEGSRGYDEYYDNGDRRERSREEKEHKSHKKKKRDRSKDRRKSRSRSRSKSGERSHHKEKHKHKKHKKSKHRDYDA